MKSDRIAARVPAALNKRLEAATTRKSRTHDPYAPSKSDIIVRGIELALAELERRRSNTSTTTSVPE